MKPFYTISCSLSNLKGLRDFVKNNLSNFGLSGTGTDEIVLAVDEMVANQIIHSNQCNPNNKFELHMEFDKQTNEVIIEIIDEGKLFNINDFVQPELKDIINERRKGGLGIRLVRAIMDKIEYINIDNKKICRMIKKFPA
jgi:serine/threonine-protein kinase RsbW